MANRDKLGHDTAGHVYLTKAVDTVELSVEAKSDVSSEI